MALAFDSGSAASDLRVSLPNTDLNLTTALSVSSFVPTRLDRKMLSVWNVLRRQQGVTLTKENGETIDAVPGSLNQNSVLGGSGIMHTIDRVWTTYAGDRPFHEGNTFTESGVVHVVTSAKLYNGYLKFWKIESEANPHEGDRLRS